MRFERAHDRNHNRSSALASCVALPAPSMEPSGEESMYGQNASEQVRVRQLVQYAGLRQRGLKAPFTMT